MFLLKKRATFASPVNFDDRQDEDDTSKEAPRGERKKNELCVCVRWQPKFARLNVLNGQIVPQAQKASRKARERERERERDACLRITVKTPFGIWWGGGSAASN